jgi:hypothetical protein
MIYVNYNFLLKTRLRKNKPQLNKKKIKIIKNPKKLIKLKILMTFVKLLIKLWLNKVIKEFQKKYWKN